MPPSSMVLIIWMDVVSPVPLLLPLPALFAVPESLTIAASETPRMPAGEDQNEVIAADTLEAWALYQDYAVDLSQPQQLSGDTLETWEVYQGYKGEIGGGFLVGFPQQGFRRNIGAAVAGFNAFFGVRPHAQPMLVGMEASFIPYGAKEDKRTWLSRENTDVTTYNGIASMYMLLRLEPSWPWIRPYVDGLAGFNCFVTWTEVDYTSEFDEDDPTWDIDDGSFAFSYGYGGGLMIQLSDRSRKKGFKPGHDARRVLLNFQFRHFNGLNVSYRKEDSFYESRPTMWVAALGVSVEF
jgi:opacity protein-like surface antigen